MSRASHGPRILVTGVGLHTGHGDTASTWAAIGENRSALTCEHAWKDVSPGLAFPAAPAPDPAPAQFLADRKSVKYMGPCTQMAVSAAGRALRDAGLLAADAAAQREAMALFLATGPIAFDVEGALASFGEEGAADLLALRHEGLRRCHPLLPFKMLLNMPLGLVSIAFGIKGPNFILYPGGDQGGCALGHALRGLRQGRFSRALVGGSACTLGLSPIMHLRRSGRLAASIEEAQPFSARHEGWAPADQAAFVVLEIEEEAARRGQRAYARLAGARVSGGGSVERLWQAFSPTDAPDILFRTGARAGLHAEREGVEARWASPVGIASADGLLGVAPAASLLLATALVCLSLREGRVPAALCEVGAALDARAALVSFHDGQGAAAALLASAMPGVAA